MGAGIEETSSGYLRVRCPKSTHPLMAGRKSDWMLLHRWVLYEQLGGRVVTSADPLDTIPGGHACAWCGWPVGWDVRPTKTKVAVTVRDRRLEVDHVNGEKFDLRVSNLVPACWWCNSTRGLLAERGDTDLARFGQTEPSGRPKVWHGEPTTPGNSVQTSAAAGQTHETTMAAFVRSREGHAK